MGLINGKDVGRGVHFEKPSVSQRQDDFIIQLTYRNDAGASDKDSLWTTFVMNAANIEFHNGKTNEHYQEPFDLLDSKGQFNTIPERCIPGVECSESLLDAGFKCNIDERGRLVVSGVPKYAFERNIFIKLVNSLDKKDPIYLPKKLVVVANDPFALWTVNPSPKVGPYPQEKDDFYKGKTIDFDDRRLTILAASKRGRMHEHAGTPRDDFFEMVVSEDPNAWHFFAVADGAGSARFSRKGSELACETVVKQMKRLFDENRERVVDMMRKEIVNVLNLRELSGGRHSYTVPAEIRTKILNYIVAHSVYEAQKAIAIEAESKSKDPGYRATLRDYYTTLLCAALKRFSIRKKNGDKRIVWALITYWVGDGALVLYGTDGNDSVELMGRPDEGDYSGETRFLTMKEEAQTENIVKRVRLTFFNDFKGIFLATDGVTDPVFPSDNALNSPQCWNKFWNEFLPQEAHDAFDMSISSEARAKALLEGMKFKVRGNHDDRTLLAIVPESRPNRRSPDLMKQGSKQPQQTYRPVTNNEGAGDVGEVKECEQTAEGTTEKTHSFFELEKSVETSIGMTVDGYPKKDSDWKYYDDRKK